MPFVSAPTDTFVAFEGYITVNTTTVTNTGYEKFADNQPEHSTKVNTGPGAVRTPKVITFKKEV